MANRGKRGAVVLVSVFALVLASIYADNASAAGYFWVEGGSIIRSNTAIEGTAAASFSLRSKVIGSKVVITCTGATLPRGAVIFNNTSRSGGRTIGAAQAELELTGCRPTSVCEEVEGGKIKIPVRGNADSTVVANGRETSEVTKLYVDTLPSTISGGGEFAKFTVICLRRPVEVTVTTSLTPKGFKELKEGEAGLLGQVDKAKGEAETEKRTHTLIYECSGEAQEPKTGIFNAEEESIMVNALKYEGNSACVTGELTVKLVSGNNFKLL